jgi:hypothetical protein
MLLAVQVCLNQTDGKTSVIHKNIKGSRFHSLAMRKISLSTKEISEDKKKGGYVIFKNCITK